MMRITRALQDIQDKFGFLVLAYMDPGELEADTERGRVLADTINSPLNRIGIDSYPIVGEALESDWIAQCEFARDPPYDYPGQQHVGFRKIVAE